MLLERVQWLGSPGQFKFYGESAEPPALQIAPSPHFSPIPKEESPILAHFSPHGDAPTEVYRSQLSEESCYICREGSNHTRTCGKCGTRYFHPECDDGGSSALCSECRQVCVHCWKRWKVPVKCPYCLQRFHAECEKLLSPENPRQVCSICVKEQLKSGGIEVCIRELECHGLYHIVKFQGLSPVHQVRVKAAKCNAEMHFLGDLPVQVMEKGLGTRVFYGIVQVQGKMMGDYREYWEPEETIASYNTMVDTGASAPAQAPPALKVESTVPTNSEQPAVPQGNLTIVISDDEGEVYLPHFSTPEKVPPAAVNRALEVFANFGYCRAHPQSTQSVLDQLGVTDDRKQIIWQVVMEIYEATEKTDNFELHGVTINVCVTQSEVMRRTCCGRLLLLEGLRHSFSYGVLTNTQLYGESFHAHPQWRPTFDNLLAAVALKWGFAAVTDGMKAFKPLKEWYLYAFPDARAVAVVAAKMEQFFRERLRYLIYCLQHSRNVHVCIS